MIGRIGRKPFKSRVGGSRHANFPTMAEASASATSSTGQNGVLFYERGFFGVVWFENSTRVMRDLKNW